MALSIGELVGYVTLNTAGVTKGVATTEAQMAGLGRTMGATSAKGAGMLSGIGKAAGTIGATMGALGIAKGISESVQLEATFSKTMAQIAASTGAPKAEMAKLNDLAMQLGAQTSFSASDASGAMLELAKAGISTSDIMGGALKGTLTLAAAGSTDLGTASTIASNAMNTFGLKGGDMASIAAALAGGANASSASVESLGQALQQVGPGATNAGLTLQETVGVLSAFDAAGIKGSDAGTSLKTMLTNLVPATTTATKAFQAYGLMQYDSVNAMKSMRELGLKPASKSFEDVRNAMSKYLVEQGVAKEGTAALAKATDDMMTSTGAMHSAFVNTDGSFKDITQTSEILKNKLGGLSESQRQTALTQIFGSDASRAATVLMKEGAAGIGKYVKATKDQDAAQKMAKANMSGTSGALERMRGSIETAGLSLGKFLAPMVVLIAGLVGGAATKFASLTGFLSDHKGVAIALAAVIGALTVVTMAHNAAMAVSAAGGMAKWLTQTKLVSAATKMWTAIQWAMNAALAANPIVLVAVALAALVAGVVVAYNKVGWFHDAVDAAFGGITSAAGAVVGFFKQHWPVLLAILTGPIGLAVLAIAKNWDKIKAGASNVVDWIKGIPGKIGALGSSFGNAGKQLLQGFIDGMKNAAGVITGIAGNVWDAVKGLLNGAIDKINAALSFKIDLPLGKSIKIDPPDIPQLATGGRATGASLAVFGEGAEAETVLPDSMLRGLLERVHESGRNEGLAAGQGRNAPVIGHATFTKADPYEVAEDLWFLTRTRG